MRDIIDHCVAYTTKNRVFKIFWNLHFSLSRAYLCSKDYSKPRTSRSL